LQNLHHRLLDKAVDELDRELEYRGHRFVRYADDCNIYVRSERAGQRVMESVTGFITQKLKLKVNEAKSAVARIAETVPAPLTSRILIALCDHQDQRPGHIWNSRDSLRM
jgi:hypothetical protein